MSTATDARIQHASCNRCQGPIWVGEFYAVIGPVYRPECVRCTTDVQGPAYWAGQYSTVCRDGYQVPFADRQHWA